MDISQYRQKIGIFNLGFHTRRQRNQKSEAINFPIAMLLLVTLCVLGCTLVATTNEPWRPNDQHQYLITDIANIYAQNYF